MSDEQDRSGRLDDLDRMARRAVDAVMSLVRRAIALAFGVLALVVVVCVGGFLLGLAALSDGIETVWTVLGGAFAVVAIGSVMIAMFRLWVVKAAADILVTEVRKLLGSDDVTQRTVIETIESTDGRDSDGVVVLSRQFFSMRDVIGSRAGQFATLTSALTAVTSFPALIALALAITAAFFGLSLIFLLALAL